MKFRSRMKRIRCCSFSSWVHDEANLKIRRRQNRTAITKMKSKQWTYLAAHINNNNNNFFFWDLARMNESPNLFKYFIVMVGNDLVCVYFYYTHLYVSHSTQESPANHLRSVWRVCSFWCYTHDDQAITRKRNEIESERLTLSQRNW